MFPANSYRSSHTTEYTNSEQDPFLCMFFAIPSFFPFVTQMTELLVLKPKNLFRPANGMRSTLSLVDIYIQQGGCIEGPFYVGSSNSTGTLTACNNTIMQSVWFILILTSLSAFNGYLATVFGMGLKSRLVMTSF